MLTLPSDATHIHISQLTKFFKIQVVNDTESYWMVYSQTLKKWVKLYHVHGKYGNTKLSFPNMNAGDYFLPITDPKVQEYLILKGIIQPRVFKTGTIMISEEDLRKVIMEAFCAGYVENPNFPYDNDFLRMAHEEARVVASKCTSFFDSLVRSVDDRDKRVSSEKIEDMSTILDSDYPPALNT